MAILDRERGPDLEDRTGWPDLAEQDVPRLDCFNELFRRHGVGYLVLGILEHGEPEKQAVSLDGAEQVVAIRQGCQLRTDRRSQTF